MKTLRTSDSRKLAFILTEAPDLHFNTEQNPRRPNRVDFIIDADDRVLRLSALYDTDPPVRVRTFLDRLDHVRDIMLRKRKDGGDR